MEVLPHKGLHGVEVRFLPFCNSIGAVSAPEPLHHKDGTGLSRSNHALTSLPCGMKRSFSDLFGLLLVHHLLPEPLCLSQDLLNHGFITEYGEL